jgi:serine/threonine protein kinase
MIEAVGRYIDQRLMGKGAYGEVFVATDPTLNRQVAIKRYFKSASDLVEVISALENWSKLNHPHIAQVLDYFDQDGQVSLVMTYCSNARLDQGVSVLKSDQGKVARLFLQIASAVGYMHGKGLIHRDLKLANVLLDSKNFPVLIDLDLCIRNDSPEIGKMVGTPGYMAPELLDENAPSSELTDQYALGVMLFEMLSGNLVSLQPEEKSSMDFSNRSFVLNSVITRRRDWNAVIAKATNIDPKARYVSISDFSDDVEKLIAGKQTSARVQSRVERISLWIRKNPSTGALLSVIAASLILGFLITSFSWSQTSWARNSIVSNTDLLKQRIEEAKLRQNELARLLTTVQQELTQAENAEKEQQQVTQAAQASQVKWQAEAERAKMLTAELDSLLGKAKSSENTVVAAEKRKEAAVARLSKEQDKLTAEKKREREQKLADVWSTVIRPVLPNLETQKWDKASRLFELLPRESSGIEIQIISNAIANKLSVPMCIRLGATPKHFEVVEVFEKKHLLMGEKTASYTDTYSFKEPCINSITFWKLNTGVFGAHLSVPSGGTIHLYIDNQRGAPKIHGLLADGSLLVSDGDGCSVVTFSPQNYTPWEAKKPRDKMNPEIEKKIEATLIPLSKRLENGGKADVSQLPKN